MGALVAPLVATLGAVAAVGAVAARSDLAERLPAPAGIGGGRSFPEAVGSLGPVRVAVAADRLADLAGRAGWNAPVERVSGIAALAAAGLAAAAPALGGRALILAAAGAVGALRAPVLLAGRAASRRTRALEREVPMLVDVLSLASFGGWPAQSALRKAVDALDGPLAEELAAAIADVDLGARWRERLRRLADDLRIAELDRVIRLLTRAESIGAGLSEPMAVLADEVRSDRRVRATERARKAPVKMLFPLVFLVLPAFLLLTVVPVLVATLGSIR